MSLVTTPGRLAHALSLALFFTLFATGPVQAQADLVITGVVDGPLTGGTPKAVELYALADIADLSLYAVGSANNGGGTDGLEAILSGSATAGDFLYLASTSEEFEAFFGFAPDFVDAAAGVNGDDAIELFYDGDGYGMGDPETVVDTFGDINVDGDGQPWEYLDGWAYRVDGTGPDDTTFVLDSWSFSGINALDGETTNSGAATPFPLGTYEAGGGSPTPVVTFTAAGGSVAEGDDATLTVTLDFPNDTPDDNPITVTVTFDEAASTATEDDDFSGPTPVQVMFDGTTDNEEQSVTVSTISGDGFEGDETAVFDLFIAGGIAELGTPATFTLAIEDGEAPDPARVQVIHNAPDPVAEFVDISIVDVGEGGDGATFQDVPFRGATSFFDLAPGTYNVLVTDEENLAVVIIDETVTVVSGETYQLIASGVAAPSLFQPNPDGRDIAATLFVNSDAQEAATTPDAVQANLVHGTTDAPTTDLLDAGNGSVFVDNAAYSDITGYVGFDDREYTLALSSADNSVINALFIAEFGGRNGEALTLLLSGFLTPENDQSGPALGLLAVQPDGTTFLLPQLFNVDIDEARSLPNGSLVLTEGIVTRAMGAFTRIQDETGGIVIRQTSGAFFDDVADGTIAPGTEIGLIGVTSEFAGLKQINGGDLQQYVVRDSVGVPEPQLVTLEEIANNGEEYESELIQVANLVIFGDGDFQPATTYEIAEFDVQFPVTLRVPNADDTAIDGTPIPPALATFTGVLGQFNNADPAAGYQLLPVQEDDVVAQEEEVVLAQIIHNAPDPAFDVVDIYVNGELTLDDVVFRTATAFLTLPNPFVLAIAPGSSTSAADAFYDEGFAFDSGVGPVQLIATGVGEGDFEPNPDGEDIAFTVLVNPSALLDSPTDDNVPDLNFVHGTPDAPAIDVRTGATQDIILYNDVVYGGITGYQPIVADVQMIEVSSADGTTTVAMFDVDLTGREDEAGTILASGFLTPDNEPGDAPSFGLLVVFADGTSFFVEPLVTPGTEDGTTVPTTFAVDGNYPNPFATTTTLRYDLPADALVSVEVYDVLGRRVAEVTPEAVSAGSGRTVELDAALPSGTYVYRVTAEMPAETRTETGRMTVVR